MRRLRGEGTPENTYVSTLVNLLKSVLKDVQVIPWPKGNAEGLPDIGIKVNGVIEGYVEAEALETPLDKNKKGWEQAQRYSKEAPTLLTNFYEFRLVDQGEEMRRFYLTKKALFTQPANEVVAAYETDLLEFLRDWADRRTPITDPEALAERLSEYAKESLHRLETASQASLAPLRDSMEKALGISIETGGGEHFFQSSVVQALFYGLFSAWVSAAQKGKGLEFELHEASSYLQVPLVIELFEELTQPSKLKNVNLKLPVEWAVEALKRVVPEPFLKAFDEGQAVQYFYEPFLQKFDKQLREDLGVWYTPREIVRYQVEKTHELLKSDLGITKGLLDERVVILDPATGTGSYLVEIGRFLLEQYASSPLAGRLVKEAFQKRIFGFELLPAPFIIAHLQLGLLLAEANAPLKEGERVGVYLTNSLLNWKAEKNPAIPLHSEWAKEKEAADSVKQQQDILVFIGNPPYNRFAVVGKDDQKELVAPYKACLRQTWDVRRETLDDLYIRFIRLAEQQIAETNPKEGVISYITNRSYLTGLSHPVMRQHLVENFHNIYIDDLHGTQRANRPDDGSVFTTDSASGVRVGVAITHLVKKKEPLAESAQVAYREYRTGTGKEKRAALVTQAQPFSENFSPERRNRYLLRPLVGEDVYWTWPNLIELFPSHFSGVNTNRDEAVIAFDPKLLSKLMSNYYSYTVTNEELAKQNSTLMKDAARYNPRKTRKLLLEKSEFREDRIIRYCYRPLDSRWLYWEEKGKLLNEKRKEFFAQVFESNSFLSSTQQAERATGFDRLGWSRGLIDLHFLRPDADAFPLKLRYKPEGLYDNDGSDEYKYLPNAPDFYDDLVRNKLLKLPKTKEGCAPMPKPDPVLSRYGTVKDEKGKPTEEAFAISEALFYHALAVMHAPAYREEHAEYLAEDWPRIPLPGTLEALNASAELGKKVAQLLDPLSEADDLLEPYIEFGRLTGDLSGDLKIGAKPAWKAGTLTLSDDLRLENVPEGVWTYTLGGYPVLSKWLGYRKDTVLSTKDALWLSEIVQRLAALINMGGTLDELYRQLLQPIKTADI